MEKTEQIEANASSFGRLTALVEMLRGENGCPWDKKQTAESMSTKLLEETYELVDAIAKEEADAVCEELGDVLFHIFFIARLFEEKGRFDIEAVVDGITRKMIRRHPHVFGDSSVSSAEEVKQQWHIIKQKEKNGADAGSVLDSIPRMLPALMRAYRMSVRVAREGFDWSSLSGVMEKVEEEWAELKDAYTEHRESGENERAVRLEFGDLLFTMVNVARFLGINPEAALAESTQKFEDRFRFMEHTIKESRRDMTSVSQREKDEIWEMSKTRLVKYSPPAEI